MKPTPFALVVLAAIGGSAVAQEAPATNRYGFPDWKPDFPVALVLPTPCLPQTYQRSRRQALERVVANLQGNTSREVWLMAIDFFGRAPEDAVEPLIAAFDQRFGEKDVVLNIVEAMGKTGRRELLDCLERSLEHPDGSVRDAGLAALCLIAPPNLLRELFPLFLTKMNGRTRSTWLRQARLVLGHDAVPLLKQVMVNETPGKIRDLVLPEVLQMPPADGAEILAALWPDAVAEFKAIIAGVFHAAGRADGTGWLHEALNNAQPEIVALALQQLRNRELGVLADDVRRASTHDNPQIRLAVAKAMVGRDDDESLKVLEVLASATELVETKLIAVRELSRRGKRDAVTVMLQDCATATGTRLETIVRLLSASGDPRAIDALLARFERAPEEEGRSLLQAISTSGAPGAAKALLALFVAEPRPVTKPDSNGMGLNTRDYVPILLANVRGQEDEVLAAWDKLPLADYGRRALLLATIGGLAGDRNDEALKQKLGALQRRVLFDSKELPQLRIQALNSLARRAIDLDDVKELRRRQEPSCKDETPAMRALIKDFLFEYF